MAIIWQSFANWFAELFPETGIELPDDGDEVRLLKTQLRNNCPEAPVPQLTLSRSWYFNSYDQEILKVGEKGRRLGCFLVFIGLLGFGACSNADFLGSGSGGVVPPPGLSHSGDPQKIASEGLIFHLDAAVPGGSHASDDTCAGSLMDLSATPVKVTLNGFVHCPGPGNVVGAISITQTGPVSSNSLESSKYMEVEHVPGLSNVQTRDFSLEEWVSLRQMPQFIDRQGHPTVYGLLQKYGYHEGLVLEHSGVFSMYHYLLAPGSSNPLQAAAYGTVTHPVGIFHHVVGTVQYLPTEVRVSLYVNGVLEGMNHFQRDFPLHGQDYEGQGWRIGSATGEWQDDWPCNADIDVGVVRIYDRTLSPAEVSGNCKAQVGRYAGARCGGN